MNTVFSLLMTHSLLVKYCERQKLNSDSWVTIYREYDSGLCFNTSRHMLSFLIIEGLKSAVPLITLVIAVVL